MIAQLSLALDPADALDMTGDPVTEPLPPANPCRCIRPLPWTEDGERSCAACGRPTRDNPDLVHWSEREK